MKGPYHSGKLAETGHSLYTQPSTLLTLLGLSSQINIRPGGGGGNIAPLGFVFLKKVDPKNEISDQN